MQNMLKHTVAEVRGMAFVLALIIWSSTCTAAFETHEGDPPVKIAGGDPAQRIVSDGVQYSVQNHPKLRCNAHTIIVDISNPGISLKIVKGLDNISGLERVHSMMHRFDSLNSTAESIAGINANYWAAGTNHPIGPTVAGGVVLNSRKYKNWSALAITRSKRLHMDTYSVEAELRMRYGVLPVSRFNERSDSLSVVVYNSYYGTTVPYIDTSWIALASADTVTDDSESDTTLEAAVDSVWAISRESGTLKAQFEYLGEPLANTMLQCRITHIDTGFVLVPKNGGVISFGKGPLPLLFSVLIGDTFSIVTRTIPEIPEPIVEMTTGTPRLVRDGRVSVEWQQEGLRKLRFVKSGYGRSALGISRDGKRVILVTVEPPNRRQRRRGIALPDLAALMIERGAWNAFNFDGGGSATMVVGDTTVSPPAGNNYSRKVSTALIVTRGRSSR